MASQPWTQEDVDRVNNRLGAVIGTRGASVSPRFVVPKPKASKYRNRRTLVDFGNRGEIVNGHLRLVWTFDSAREAEFYRELVIRRDAGEVQNMRLQEPFALKVATPGDDVIVGEYLADATFYDAREKRFRVCDVKSKGTRTAVYLLKKKIVEACYGITIEEI